ncbi:MAG: hypothetical protein E6J77_18620, partial [Deltaproteobacteria bacterium]
MPGRHPPVISREIPPDLQIRIVVAVAVAYVAFSLVGVRLWYLQLERGAEMRSLSEHNRIRLVRLPGS